MTTPIRAFATVTAVGLAATAGYLTARRNLHAELTAARHAAHHDPLTGIRNRAGLAATADTFITQQSRLRPVVVALVDLVGFKQVNDTHGHDAGDHILTATAARLTDIGGIAARLGGDEFALITTAPTTGHDDWLTGVHTALTTPVTYQGRALPVGATIGAVLADPNQPATVWLHRADLAMYAARTQRRTTAILTDFPATGPAADIRPTQRARDLARPTSRLASLTTRRVA